MVFAWFHGRRAWPSYITDEEENLITYHLNTSHPIFFGLSQYPGKKFLELKKNYFPISKQNMSSWYTFQHVLGLIQKPQD